MISFGKYELFAVHQNLTKVLRWSVTEPKNQDLSCPLRHHPDDLLRPDLVQLLQEAQPHQVRRIFCTKKYFALRKISSNYLLRYLDVLYAEDGEDSEELPYVPEVKSSNNNQLKRSIHSLRIGPIVFQQP